MRALSLLVLFACSCGDVKSPDGDDTDAGTLTVEIASPRGEVFTNGVVDLELVVAGDPDEVRLLADEVILATVDPPSGFSWETSTVGEGDFEVVAEASRGSDVARSNVLVVHVDRTSPTILARVPEDGASEFFVRDVVRASFSEPLHDETVHEDAVLLSIDGVDLAKSVELSGDGMTLTIDPVGVPSVPTTISVALLGDLTDLAGNALVGGDDPWEIELPEWLDYGTFPGGDLGARMARVALGPGEDVVLARFEAIDLTTHRVLVDRWQNGAWTPLEGLGATSLLRAAAGNKDDVAVAVDAAGIVYVAWSEAAEPDLGMSIHVASSSGGAWQPVGDPVSAGGGTHATLDVSLALDANGLPTIAWSEDAGTGAYDIRAARFDGAGFVDLGALQYYAGATTAVAPSVAILDDEPVVAWAEWSPSEPVVFVRRHDGEAWQDLGPIVTRFAAPGHSTLDPDIESIGGRLLVSIRQYSGTAYECYVLEWDGAAWVPVGAAASAVAGATSSLMPSTTFAEGVPVLATVEEATPAGTSDARVLSFETGAWTSVASFSMFPAVDSNAWEPSLVGDAEGGLVLAFSEWDPIAPHVFVRRYNR